eukprot:JP439066.1.p2 GENE.JP439066.1~~JP439066.1.p2  ORF type:complete len:54 (-),score=5.88 JP439066.1:98-259(-)
MAETTTTPDSSQEHRSGVHPAVNLSLYLLHWVHNTLHLAFPPCYRSPLSPSLA